MARDKIYGFLIFIFALLVLLYYTYWALIYPFMFYSVFPTTTVPPTAHPWWPILGLIPQPGWVPVLMEPYWAVAIPVWLAIVLVLFIVMWIGWTMMTTPPPIPLEEIEEEEEAKEE